MQCAIETMACIPGNCAVKSSGLDGAESSRGFHNASNFFSDMFYFINGSFNFNFLGRFFFDNGVNMKSA